MKHIQTWQAAIIFMICVPVCSAHDCDRLAGSPNDPSRVTEGVPPEKIDTTAALSACSKAVAENPANARFHYQYGRALNAAKLDVKAIVQYHLAADQGYAPAQYNLGVMYDSGRGVAKDDTEAVKWYRKAADQGYAPAQFNLGIMYANGRGVAKDDTEAVKWYRKAADQGFAPAQFNLGVGYDSGRGVAKDGAEAVKWYRKAADQGQVEAQYNLGVMYDSGRGVVKDDTEAVKWYRKAADQGHQGAKNRLSNFSGQNLGEKYANDVASQLEQRLSPACQVYPSTIRSIGSSGMPDNIIIRQVDSAVSRISRSCFR